MFQTLLNQVDAEDEQTRNERIAETARDFELDEETVAVIDHATRKMLNTLQSAKAEDLQNIGENNPAAKPIIGILSHELIPEKTGIALSKDPVTLAQVVRSLDALLEAEDVYRDLELGEPNIGHLYPEERAGE